eukprot:Sdes_comp16135_c0_seq1m5379
MRGAEAIFRGILVVLLILTGKWPLLSASHHDHHNAWAVFLHDSISPFSAGLPGLDELAQNISTRLNLINHGRILPGVYLFSKDCDTDNTDSKSHCARQLHRRDAQLTDRIQYEPGVLRVEQQRPRSRFRRRGSLPIFTDPLYPDQWHLHNARFPGKDMKILDVWTRGYTGHGIVISVIDDGLEHTHPDLHANFLSSCSYDFNFDSPDVTPRYKEADGSSTDINNHGTRCAGVIASVANNSCGVGVAYNSKICGVKIIDGPPNDSMEAKAFSHAIDQVDIYSSSWGPNDDGATVEGPLQLARRSIELGVNHGRGGKGSIYIFASGNGGGFG